MKEIKKNHYIDTVIYSVDMIIRNLKFELRRRVDNLGMGITAEQFVVLDTISLYKDLYQQKLSDILMKDKSNTTRILKVLEDKGLINRVAGKVNNRLVYMLNITKEGKDLVKHNMPKIKKIITTIFKSITDDEIDILHSLSDKVQKDLTQIARS